MSTRKWKASRAIQFITIGEYLVSREKNENAWNHGSFSEWVLKVWGFVHPQPQETRPYDTDQLLVRTERDMDSTHHTCHRLTDVLSLNPQQPGKYL